MRKTSVLLLIAALCIFHSADAQSIVGKWKCSKEFLQNLGLGYEIMKGTYKFKKDGTFQLKMNGITTMSHSTAIGNYGGKPRTIGSEQRTIYVKVSGTYAVINDSISTVVNPEDVYCFIEPDMVQPDGPDASDSENTARTKEWLQRRYETEVNISDFQAQTIKEEISRIWIWNGEPLTLTKKTMAVGNKFFFRRR